jgi:hypothetical protein
MAQWEPSGFVKLMQVKVINRSPERSEAELFIREELCNRRGGMNPDVVGIDPAKLPALVANKTAYDPGTKLLHFQGAMTTDENMALLDATGKTLRLFHGTFLLNFDLALVGIFERSKEQIEDGQVGVVVGVDAAPMMHAVRFGALHATGSRTRSPTQA